MNSLLARAKRCLLICIFFCRLCFASCWLQLDPSLLISCNGSPCLGRDLWSTSIWELWGVWALDRTLSFCWTAWWNHGYASTNTNCGNRIIGEIVVSYPCSVEWLNFVPCLNFQHTGSFFVCECSLWSPLWTSIIYIFWKKNCLVEGVAPLISHSLHLLTAKLKTVKYPHVCCKSNLPKSSIVSCKWTWTKCLDVSACKLRVKVHWVVRNQTLAESSKLL